MGTAAKQLEQLNEEIAALNPEVKAAKKDWLSATDPRQEAKLEKVYEDLKKEKERLDSRRAELEAFEAYESAAAATTRAAIALAGAPSDKMLQLLHDAAQKEEHRALGRYEDLKKKEERLLEDRRALQAKLPGAGERTPLLPC